MKDVMKAIIVSGGSLNIELLKNQIEKYPSYTIISVDGGTNLLFDAGILPDILIGDFDSINKEIFKYFQNKGIKTLKFAKEKDLTDTHIAIEYAANNNIKEIILLGATGKRLDHTLSNLYIIEKYIKDMYFKIIDSNNTIEFLYEKGRKIFEKEEYKYISLVPISDIVMGVVTEGLKYELINATLLRSDSFGVSNEIINNKGSISINKGLLAIIKSKD